MDTGIYVALSKEIGIFHDMEVTANNIANVATTGYQAEDLLFSDYLVTGNKMENKVAFANDLSTWRSLNQGTLQMTGNPLNVAIEGPGYFAVQTPLGVRYTRSGSFKTDPTGNLVTAEGYPVLDEGGQPITFDEADRVIEIHEDGVINVDGSDRGTLKIAQFDNEQLLQRVGNTMYKSDLPPKPAENFRLVAGAVERSNVNSFKSLTHLMTVSRGATEVANLISNIYLLERKASDSYAKVYS